jgi:acylphosphatase
MQKAQELGIFGWVRNLSDGRVEAVMEGSKVNIDKMLTWCKEGPLEAKVEEVKIIDEVYQNEFLTFDITKTL